MKPSSEKRLPLLHPVLASAVRGVIADLETEGLAIEVVQGLRTFAEPGCAVCEGADRAGADWNAPMQVWTAIGEAAIAHGLEWGGQWKKFLDKPHVQLPSMTVKECARCYQTAA